MPGHTPKTPEGADGTPSPGCTGLLILAAIPFALLWGASPSRAASPYELIARWPDVPNSNYTRVFPSHAVCDRARSAIEVDHQRRVAAVREGNRPANGALPTVVALEPNPPIAICIPR